MTRAPSADSPAGGLADGVPPTLQPCDLLVIGSGAGGLSAAVTAAHLGLKVIVVEKENLLGGTTAWSGGWMWVPRNPLARQAGIHEDLDAVRCYLRGTLGAQYASHARRLEAFLAHAPDMVQFYLEHTALRFVDGNHIPDFHGHVAGARDGGRSVCAAPFDSSRLGPLRAHLRPPRDVLSWLGMSIGADVHHFQRAGRLLRGGGTGALKSAAYVARRLLRQSWDQLRYGQGTLRMGGNALAAALLCSARDKGVQFLLSCQVLELLREGGRVVGARVMGGQGQALIRARCGVVLACGGFAHDVPRKRALFAHAPTGQEHWSAAPPGNTGDGLRLAEQVGAVLATDTADAGAWAPVSLVPRKNAAPAAFPHLLERGKPGLMAVDIRGERFVDEAGDYHSFMRALLARAGSQQPVQAWLICDHRFQRRYGLGWSKPWPLPLFPYLKSGYLHRALTLGALAQRCGIDAPGLEQTVERHNRAARIGQDPQFGRGRSAYGRMQGDSEHPGPNPCVAPLEQPPFYAVRIVPGSLGTFAGLATNGHAQALDSTGTPIAGLYAAGNDMASIMGGHYPSGGITLGPAMTFGWILAHHAAARPLPIPDVVPSSSPTLEQLP